MRIVFAGSPAAAIPALQALVDSSHEVLGVFSQPAKPVGRKKVLTETPVASFALERGIKVFTPSRSEQIEPLLADLRPDLAIAVAYGHLIRPGALTTPRWGWWNVHFSLLPSWRGAAPVQRALLAGESTTGVTIFQMDEGLDTGPILFSAEYPIPPGITAGALLEELARWSVPALLATLASKEDGSLVAQRQSGRPTYAPKLSRDEGWLRCSESASEVMARYQACTPEPGAYFRTAPDGQPLAIRSARLFEGDRHIAPGDIVDVESHVVVGCAEGALVLERVLSPGSREMTAAEWRRGAGRGVRFDL